MLRISNTQVYGLEESCIASGYPMRTDLPHPMRTDLPHEFSDGVYADFEVTPHYKRSCKLGNAQSNSGHANFLTGIIVQFDVTYPAYWSMQFQRYHFAQFISSQSKMHKLAFMDLKSNVNKYVTDNTLVELGKLQDVYNTNPTYENYMQLLSNCPMGLELTARISTNYLQLKNIYNQRKTHKLKEDWGEFCSWVEQLPHFKELTGI